MHTKSTFIWSYSYQALVGWMLLLAFILHPSEGFVFFNTVSSLLFTGGRVGWQHSVRRRLSPLSLSLSLSSTSSSTSSYRQFAGSIRPSWIRLRMMSSNTTATLEIEQMEDTMNPKNSSGTTFVGPELPPLSATTKRLFWIRHGEVINPGGNRHVFYGAMDVPLSSLGQLEAQAAAQYLRPVPLNVIVCSPLSRAMYGAEQIAKIQQEQYQGSNIKIHVLDGFKELDRGEWCGKTKEEITHELMSRFDAGDESVTPVGGESYSALRARVLEARNMVLHHLVQPGQQAAIVSHLQVTRSILSDAFDIPVHEMSKLKIATASVTCIDYDVDTSQDDTDSIIIKMKQTVHFQSFKPKAGLDKSVDGAN